MSSRNARNTAGTAVAPPKIPQPPAARAPLQEPDEDLPEDLGDLSESADAYGDEAALQGLNDPQTATLDRPPLIGGREISAGNLYGRDATSFGRASSPPLWSSSAQNPQCVQLRVWRMENGIPVGLGAIDAGASEEDFVREFYDAMPKRGSGRLMFRLRPLDMRGEELGKEFMLPISEHHAALSALRREKEEAAREAATPMSQNFFQPPHEDNGAAYAAEMSRMFEKAVEAADQRTDALMSSLEEERARLRTEDDRRAQERIDMATQAASGVQAITERMMRDESNRAERSMQAQQQQSQMLLTTLTQIFTQAQQQQQELSQSARTADQVRLEQERQYAERIRMEEEARRKRDLSEAEERRKLDQVRLDDERKMLQAQLENQFKQAQLRMEQEKAEIAARMEAEKERLAHIAKLESERAQERVRAEENRIQREIADLRAKEDRDRLEREHRWKLDQEERDRKDRRDAEDRARERETAREERERRAKVDAELQALRMAQLDRQAHLEAEATRQRETERQRAHDLALKQLDVAAQRDREHAERMIAMQQQQLQAQQAAAAETARQAREDALLRDQERQRAHERLLKEAELQAQKDREHAERMMQLSRAQMESKEFGGLGALLPKAKEWLGALGMEPADVVQRVFGGGGGGEAASGSGWAEAVPKMLGALAEMGKVALDARAQQQAQAQPPQMMPQMTPYILPAGMMPPGMLAPGVVPPGAVPTMLGGQMPNVTVPTLSMPQPASAGNEAAAALNDLPDIPDPAAEPEAAAEPEPEAPVEEEQEAKTTTEIAKEKGLTLPTQRNARKAIRALVRKISGTPESAWLGHVATAIQNEMAIYHYCKAVTMRTAILEGGASDELANRFLTLARESGVIPSDVEFE